MNYDVKKTTITSTAFEHFILIKVIKYEVIGQFKGITAQILSPTVHFNDILSKNEPNVMETSTVCTILTETPTNTTRELSNDQKYRPQFGTVIKVGKAVIFVSFTFYRLLRRKKIFIYLPFWYEAQILPSIITQPCKIRIKTWNVRQDICQTFRLGLAAPGLFWL